MSKSTRIAILLAILAACLFFLIVPPEKIWPGRLPFASFKGKFTSEPVSIPLASTSIQGENIPLQVKISMQFSTCEVKLASQSEGDLLFTMGRGNWRQNLPADETLVLDPKGFSGSYNVFVGYPFHPLAPIWRISLLGGLALGIVVALVLLLFPGAMRRLKGREKKMPDARKIITVGAILLVSSFLYSIVHELGHVVFGLMAGGTLRRVVWTIFFLEEPHVEFSFLPQGWGSAWMSAGGMILPTLVGLSLVALWLVFRKKLPFFASALVLVPGMSLLLGNIGGLIEATAYLAGGPAPHMIPMGIQLGLGVFGTALFSCLPFALTAAAYVLVLRALRKPRHEDSASRSREK